MKLPLSITALITLVSWSALGYTVTHITPHSTIVIALVITTLFLALSSTTTLLLYSALNLRKGNYLNRPALFQQSLRRGIFIATAVSVTAFLKLLSAATILTIGLMILLIGSIEIYFSQKSESL